MKNKNYLPIKSILCRLCLWAFVVSTAPLQAFSQLDPTTAPQEYRIPDLKYPKADAFVISYNLMDFTGADNTGTSDMTILIQRLLDRLGTRNSSIGGINNGGVLFLPEGKYLVTGKITVPKGVTIRGEWKKPVKGEAVVGTIIVAKPNTVDREDEGSSLFVLQPAAGIKDMTFWYPDQEPANIRPYPPTILFGEPGFFGNEFSVAQNVTLVNSYIGLALRSGGGGAPNMFGIYGTPLKVGIEIDYIAEVGRIEGVDFSPAYWAGSGLPGSPGLNTSYKSWIKNNGTAVVMRRNDWTLSSHINAEGYFIGFHAVRTKKLDNNGNPVNDRPNGQNYKMTFTDCTTAIYASDPQYCGLMFHQVDAVNCEYGLFVSQGAGGVVQLTDCNLQATKYAVGADAGSSTRILMNQCTIISGKIEVQGSTLDIMNSDINNDAPQIIIGTESRAIIAGNRFAEDVDIDNQSMYECKIDHTPMTGQKRIPEFPYQEPQTIKQKPDRIQLYVATSFGAAESKADNTTEIQSALNKAKEEGGGIVFLPTGNYKVLGHLTIPTGVELKGSTDIGSVPLGPGSVLEVYADKGNEAGEPFLKMEENSGLRGIVFNYPEQRYTEIARTSPLTTEGTLEPYKYPYAIQVKGKDVYIVNAGFRATYRAIDLFTYKCDNAYVEYPSGHVFMNCLHIGGGTENARINNTQFNTIGYACGVESKFGRWPNSPTDISNNRNRDCYNQNYSQLEFLRLGDCKNLMLFNNFGYGSNYGTVFANEGDGPSGLAIGHGIDSATKGLYYEKIGADGFDMITSQIVSTQRVIVNNIPARYVETAPDFTGEITLFNADFWGNPYYGIEIGGGIFNLQTGHFDNPGGQRFAQIATDKNGKLRVSGSSINARSNRPINDGAESHFSVQTSITDPGNLTIANCEKYLNNLTHGLVLVFENQISRTGWIASSSINNNNANRAVDDNPSTRWDTGGQNKAVGDWFAVNMIEPQVFNKILFDQATSTNDYPRGYNLYLSDDGVDWGEPVVTGKGSASMTIVTLPEAQTAQYVKLALAGTEGLGTSPYWSIHEFYIALQESGTIEYPGPSSPGTPLEQQKMSKEQIYYAGGRLFVTGLSDNAQIMIYSISGQLVKSIRNNESELSLPLPSGIYVVVGKSENGLCRQKIVVK